MSTRLYFGQQIATPTLAFSAAWSAPGTTPTRLLARTTKRKAASSTTPTVKTVSETTAAILNKQHVQLIARLGAAQTITGTVKGYALFSESDLAQDCRVQCEIRVISETGTVRGTLRAADADALSSEFVATATNRRIPLLAASNTLSSVNALAGDYIVIEIGHRTHVASGTSYNATLTWSDDPATGDLPEDESSTDTTLAPWIEFSQTLVLSDVLDQFSSDDVSSVGTGPLGEGLGNSELTGDPDQSILAEFASPSIDIGIASRQASQVAEDVEPSFLARETVGALSVSSLYDNPLNTTNSSVGTGDIRPKAEVIEEIEPPAPPVPVPPSVENVSPAVASVVTPNDPIAFDVIAPDGLRRTIICVDFSGSDKPPELAHDGDIFRIGYADSTRTPITAGFRYVLRRSGGWLAAPKPLVFSFDITGQEL